MKPDTPAMQLFNTRNRHSVFSGSIIAIEEMEVEIRDGWHTFQIVRHPGGAAVLPVHGDGSVTLISQVRPAMAERIIEVPAGRLSPGEPPEQCAARELTEETGCSAETLIPLGMMYSSPGVFDEIIHLYAAKGLVFKEATPEPDEDIELLRMPLEKALELVISGSIRDAKTIIALFRWQEHLVSGRERDQA